MKSGLFALAALLAVPGAAGAAPKLSAANKAWIDTCARRLVANGENTPKAARIYCACMHENVENNEEMSQSDLEHSWPPVHLACYKKAGRR